jgi:uncharacterized membrane protein SpoIIM required for sporulation
MKIGPATLDAARVQNVENTLLFVDKPSCLRTAKRLRESPKHPLFSLALYIFQNPRHVRFLAYPAPGIFCLPPFLLPAPPHDS